MRNFILILISIPFFFACRQSHKATDQNVDSAPSKAVLVNGLDSLKKVVKTAAEWKRQLSEKEYHILREKGTEPSFSGDLLDNKKTGTYTCAGCQLPLFSSSTKFESGTGWPSFWQAINDVNVTNIVDRSYGMTRVEIVCSQCDGHLGHVFEDGPKPTGLRYCVNAVSLDFIEELK